MGDIGITSTITKHRNTNIVDRLDISGSNNFLKFCEWLYQDAAIFLQRKYDKYLFAKELITKNKDRYKNWLKTERKGEKNGRAVLTKELVYKIREDALGGMDAAQLSDKYQIKQGHIRKILREELWKECND